MDTFEGYVGIRLWDGQLVNDVIFALLMCLFVTFSFVFRFNYKLFLKMGRDAIFLKERQNLFDGVIDGKQEMFFRNFMTFQFLFLSTIGLVIIARAYNLIHYTDLQSVFVVIACTFGLLFFYYQFKQTCYWILGKVFAEPDRYRLWKTSYNALMNMWGVSLYVPVLWLIFVEKYRLIPVILLFILYISCRLVIIYKTIRIFYRKSSSFIYITLYLCGLEILPLFFLYEGIIYMYNFIESSSLWH